MSSVMVEKKAAIEVTHHLFHFCYENKISKDYKPYLNIVIK